MDSAVLCGRLLDRVAKVDLRCCEKKAGEWL